LTAALWLLHRKHFFILAGKCIQSAEILQEFGLFMGKKLRIALAVIILLPVALVVTGSALLYYQRDLLLQKVITTVNDSIDGAMTVGAIRIAPFDNFPYVSIDLRQVSFHESKDLDQRPLYTFGDLYLGFDLRDILAGNLDIKSLRLENGHLDVVQRADGSFNLLSAKGIGTSGDTATSSDATGLDLNLNVRDLRIHQVDISFHDEADEQEVTVLIDALAASIRYQQQHLYIDLESDLLVDIRAQGIPAYFTGLQLHLDLEGDYDERSGKLQVLPSLIALNEAQFQLEGSVDTENDLDMLLRLRGDKPDFSLLAAFLPPEIAEGLGRYQNAGAIFFEGTVAGKVANGQLPTVDVQFGTQDSWFLNPQTQTRVEDLRFTGSFSTGEDGNLQNAILLVNDIHAKPDEGVFEGRLAIQNFLEPIVKLDIHADLDLEFLGRFLQLEELEQVRGKILLDMNFDEIVDLDFPGDSLARLKNGIDSELSIRDLYFTVPTLGQTVEDMNAYAVMRDGVVRLEQLSLRMGGSDLQLTGALSDFPALFHRYDEPLRIEARLSADKLDVAELLAFDKDLANRFDEEVENLSVAFALETRAAELFDFTWLPKGRFVIDDLYAQFKHYPHVLHDVDADIRIGERDIEVRDFRGEIDDTDFHFSGRLDNYPKWFQDEPMGDSLIEFDLVSRHFSLEDLLSYRGENYVPESYRSEVFRDTALHGRVALHYDKGLQSFDLYLDELSSQTLFHPLKLENFHGRAHYEDGHLQLEEFAGRMGESDFTVTMSYYLGDEQQHQQRENVLVFRSTALDLDALTGYEEDAEPVDHAEAFNIFEVPFPNLQVDATIGRLNYHRYWLEDVELALRLQDDHYLYVDNLTLGVAGGGMTMSGYFNGSDPDHIYFHSDIQAKALDIDKLMIKFDNFGQDALLNDNVHGKVTGRIQSTFRMHPDLTPILEESEAHLELSITEGSLVDFAPAMAMADYFGDRNLSRLRFDKLENTLDLKDGVITIPTMLINTSVGFMEISGRQNLDASMAYFVRVPLRMVTQVAWRKLFGGRGRNEVDSSQEDAIEEVGDLTRTSFLNIRVSGTPEDYQVTLGREQTR
jgi:hypothetical protein